MHQPGVRVPSCSPPKGEPLRADVKLSLTQTGEPPKGPNPTQRAQAGFGVHRVKDGDTLPSISYSAYGDATKWRLIAEANGVDNPMHLRRGPHAVAAEPRDLMPAAGRQAEGRRRSTS